MSNSRRSGAAAVVLAASSGVARQIGRPKPLDTVCGTPILSFVLEQIDASRIDRAVIVTGEHAGEIETLVFEGGFETDFDVVVQSVARGSADAALVGAEALIGDDLESEAIDDVVIVPSDVVMLSAAQIDELVQRHSVDDVAATVMRADRVESAAVYCLRRDLLAPALRRVRPDNTEGALLLADVIDVLSSAGHRVATLLVQAETVAGIDDGVALARVEADLRRRINERWLRGGVVMVDAEHTYIDRSVELSEGVTLMSGVVLGGSTVIADGACIGPDTHLVDTTVGVGAVVTKTSAMGAAIGARAHVGPFAALGVGARIEPDSQTGPFYADPSSPAQT